MTRGVKITDVDCIHNGKLVWEPEDIDEVTAIRAVKDVANYLGYSYNGYVSSLGPNTPARKRLLRRLKKEGLL